MENLEINKTNINHCISVIEDGFLLDFIKSKKYLILDTNERIIYSVDDDGKITISCKHLFPSEIEIVNKYFKDKWMLSTGILGDRDFIRINILN